MPDVGRVGIDAVQQRAPQGRLPVEVRVDITGDIGFPVDEELGSLARVGREETGQPSRHGIAPTQPQLLLLACLEVPEVGGQGLAPVVVAAVVDDFEERPHECVGVPRVVVHRSGDLGDERTGVAEGDAGADAVLPVPAAEDVRQPLAQPPLDALRRDDDDLFGEGVVKRVGEEGTEAVGQEVRPFGTVDMQAHHRAPRGPAASAVGGIGTSATLWRKLSVPSGSVPFGIGRVLRAASGGAPQRRV